MKGEKGAERLPKILVLIKGSSRAVLCFVAPFLACVLALSPRCCLLLCALSL